MKINKNLFHKLHWIITIILFLSTVILFITNSNNNKTLSVNYHIHPIGNFTRLKCDFLLGNDFSWYRPDENYISLSVSNSNYVNPLPVSNHPLISVIDDKNINMTYATVNENYVIISNSETELIASNENRMQTIYIAKEKGEMILISQPYVGKDSWTPSYIQGTRLFSCNSIN